MTDWQDGPEPQQLCAENRRRLAEAERLRTENERLRGALSAIRWTAAQNWPLVRRLDDMEAAVQMALDDLDQPSIPLSVEIDRYQGTVDRIEGDVAHCTVDDPPHLCDLPASLLAEAGITEAGGDFEVTLALRKLLPREITEEAMVAIRAKADELTDEEEAP